MMYRRYSRYDYDDYDREDYDCGGHDGGCEGCECCEEETSTSKLVVARKARRNILPGDLVRVTSGFTYQKNGGPRTGYFHRESIVGYGPGHGPEKMGKGWYNQRGGFRANHPDFADEAEARDTREKAEREAREQAEREAREAERQARRDAHNAICRAKTGETVTYQGQTWVAGPDRSKVIMHSNLEYAGGAGDCSVIGVRTLTNTETGETVEYRTSGRHF